MDYLSNIGFPMERIEAEGIVSPVVSVNCKYKKVCRLNEIICIHIKAREYNGIKLVLEYEMREKTSGELRTMASSEHCFTNKHGMLVNVKKVFPKLDEALQKTLDGNG